ncbi:hypothetical protein ACFV1W_37250, partial [Kitasatospora sp. NPDC059648]|uniref:hypothetical protein n=1 Tax=Kitasatospora sp. NPDC059648 TaxID=3346894 RepID=UPI0036BFD4BF
MSWRYLCGTCRTVTEHSHVGEAYVAQREHIAAVHHGRTPEGDEVRPLTDEELGYVSGPPLPSPAYRPPHHDKPSQPPSQGPVLALLVVL